MTAEPAAVARSSKLSLRPLTGHIGAEVTGLDLRSLDENNIATIRDAFHDHQVLFFPGAPSSTTICRVTWKRVSRRSSSTTTITGITRVCLTSPLLTFTSGVVKPS